jgi:CubicO group peptidase (beta-lactamase class C family)
LGLDAPVRQYLPWFRLADEAASARITVRQLLNHTSGISGLAGNAFWRSQAPLEAVARQLDTVPLAHPPGEKYEYSNLNFTLAGALVEAQSGMSFGDYVEQRVFAPLDMRHSFARHDAAVADGLAGGHRYHLFSIVPDTGPQPPAYVPAGFLASSVEDVTHYAIAELNGGRYQSTQVLSPGGMAETHRPTFKISPRAQYTMALGWIAEPDNPTPYLWHNGDDGRYHSIVLLAPSQRWAVVVLANASGFEVGTGVDEIGRQVIDRLTGQTSPSTAALGTFFGALHALGFAAPVLQLGAALFGLALLRRWRRGLGTSGWRWYGWLFRVVVPVLLSLLIAFVWLVGLPQFTTVPLSAQWLFWPDYTVAITLSSVLGLGWALLWPTLVYTRLPPAGRPGGTAEASA